MTRDIWQVKFEIDALNAEIEEIKKDSINKKVDEFVSIFKEYPPKDDNDLKRMLSLLATDIKVICDK